MNVRPPRAETKGKVQFGQRFCPLAGSSSNTTTTTTTTTTMADSSSIKRKAEAPTGEGEEENSNNKRAKKTKKQWRTPKTGPNGEKSQYPGSHTNTNTNLNSNSTVQAGDTGIFVTCHRGKEGKCTGEVMDLLQDYAERLYSSSASASSSRSAAVKEDGEDDGDGDGDGDGKDDDGNGGEEVVVDDDIEKEILAEVREIRKPKVARLFTPVQLNVQCVIFFKTTSPVEPVSLVKTICSDAMNNKTRKRTRFALRLTPMTLMGRASTEGLEQVALKVLAPHFHQEPFRARTFAIRPTIRNHNVLTRDSVIKQVADVVGEGHKVDLKNYELMIVVEIYQHICGISVVDNDFERLKRYNISELYEPSPKEQQQQQQQQEDVVKHEAEITAAT
ncbi:uncharacterized protein SEPMUDRAFT_151948 [Sphaerulina musiva SO2202]|uniref:THUMP domain-containing protein n=1 Tax=Sphaerulina musiva (strain SO2202) TaxID=692275 RepID=M3AUF4_SPHMS|nr:uncharacterized protein SEPMUDRAFT_151948 [Sphaerulina musiva SO2202]EMF09129.1 hypothetical protein SEPMUDRAFT_151948 [Sphaerulina musiva SO2202]